MTTPLVRRLGGLLASPWLALAFRLYLGGVFIYASLYKINFAGEFAASVAAYQLAPYWSVNAIAVVMPWLEFVAGGLLILGVRSKAATFWIIILLVLFIVAIALALWREIPMSCGCFSAVNDPMDWTSLLRDGVWLAMALHVYRYDRLLQLDTRPMTQLQQRMDIDAHCVLDQSP